MAVKKSRPIQTRRASLTESMANIGVGAIISILVTQVLGHIMGYNISIESNLLLTGVLTVVSVGRSYVIRRLFEYDLRNFLGR